MRQGPEPHRGQVEVASDKGTSRLTMMVGVGISVLGIVVALALIACWNRGHRPEREEATRMDVL